MEVPTDGLLMSCFSQDWLLFIIDVDSADLVIAIARKRCFVCSAVYSWSSGDKTAIFFSIKEEANKKLASISYSKMMVLKWSIDRLTDKW